MADLIQAYFQRNLSPAEDAELAAQLESDDAALAFARLAADDYAAMGLPEPVWPGERRRKPWLWLGLLAAGAGAGIVAWQRLDAPAGHAPLLIEDSQAPGLTLVTPVSASETQAQVPAALPAYRLRVRAGRGGFVAALDPSLDPAPALRVLDRQGALLRTLAPGADGAWTWDGKDASGRAVAAGAYQFAVDAQGRVLSQWVQVGRRIREKP